MARQQSDAVPRDIESGRSSRADLSEVPETSLLLSEPPSSATAHPPGSIEDASAVSCSADFCRVTGTPEELILDCGLNLLPTAMPSSVKIKQRFIVSYYPAKRLLNALALSIQRHEIAFGTLETDVQKRAASCQASPTGMGTARGS